MISKIPLTTNKRQILLRTAGKRSRRINPLYHNNHLFNTTGISKQSKGSFYDSSFVLEGTSNKKALFVKTLPAVLYYQDTKIASSVNNGIMGRRVSKIPEQKGCTSRSEYKFRKQRRPESSTSKLRPAFYQCLESQSFYNDQHYH